MLVVARLHQVPIRVVSRRPSNAKILGVRAQ